MKADGRRGPLKTSVIIVIALLLVPCFFTLVPRSSGAPAAPAASKGGRRNLLLVTLDTTRADRLGCYGYAPAATPAIDG
ncbi:MAG: hypothetical protein JW742_01580, partial [Candidatus Aminicenantes bacterium]|nr:hypothetical protein [Candidatus Aminicenantes bacterium]